MPNFPNNPNIGDKFIFNKNIYEFDGIKWILIEKNVDFASGLLEINRNKNVSFWFGDDEEYLDLGYDKRDTLHFFNIDFTPVDATGGTITDININGTEYRIHAFTSVGTSNFIVNDIGSEESIDVLIVGGGGGGGSHVPGGGGAGGLVWKQKQTISEDEYTIIVGAGGIGSFNPGNYGGMPNATVGQNSSAFALTAIGGGFGGSWTQDIRSNNGGSGGGRNTDRNSGARLGLQPSQPGESGQFGFGNNGGISLDPSQGNYGGGGGGGAGEPGQNPTNRNIGGNGGIGLNLSSFFGSNYGDEGWFAGGGGGGGWGIVNPIGDGAKGGGGDGDCPTGAGSGNSARRGTGEPTGYNGLPNTGGGGGGAGRTGGSSSRGGNGGSGIVLIRYPLTKPN